MPASAATLAPCDAIFTRMGAHDVTAAGQSTFAVEMAEAAMALALSTPNSLLVMDELGRYAGGVQRGKGSVPPELCMCQRSPQRPSFAARPVAPRH